MTNTPQQTWAGKPVTILGLSKSGAAVARYIAKRGGNCFLSETLPASPGNEALKKELEALGVTIEMGGHTKQCFTHATLVVASPGIPPSNSVMEQLRLTQADIVSEVELAYRETLLLSKPVPVIGITGTNGKSTTTSLVSHVLTQAGFAAPACGNIGVPLLTVLDDTQYADGPDFLVSELSSFQLTLSPTLKAKIAIFTNLTPDHLDWHGSLDAYLQAKLQLFTGSQSPEWSVINADDPVAQTIAQKTTGKIVWVSRHADHVAQYPNRCYLNAQQQAEIVLDNADPVVLFQTGNLQILGAHNEENAMYAAATAFLLGVKPNVIAAACSSFKSLPHRLEYVTEIDGVRFYNDSKATNPEAAIPALRAFEKLILIAGGYDKNTPLDEFATEVKQHAQAVVLIGKASERFDTELRHCGYTAIHFATSLEQAVENSLQLAKQQHIPVVFSPACASFDMFKTFEDRGDQFKQAVNQRKQNKQRVEQVT